MTKLAVYIIYTTVWLFAYYVHAGEKQPRYEDFFTSNTLRIDYYHWGTATSEQIAIDKVVVQGPWPGSKKNLLDSTGFGKYLFVVKDKRTGKKIFSRGYCTLFGEWQTTKEAKKQVKVFKESVRFPKPKQNVVVEFYARNKKGKLEQIFQHDINPDWYKIDTRNRFYGAETVLLHGGGPPEKRLDIVILPDGYTKAQDKKLRADLKRFAEIFVNTSPFNEFKDLITIRAVILYSKDSGTSEPRKGIFKNTVLGTSFDTFGSARYLTTVNMDALYDAAALVPYDTIYVLVNTSRYGGAGIYNFFSIFVSDNQYDEYVFIHEFGHGFAGLADEYYSSSVAYSDFYPRGVEPWEPNITALLKGADHLKWKKLVSPSVPIPTPDTSKYDKKIGAFEGAGYSAKGLYRPARDCKMFSKKHIDFCLVCRTAIIKMLMFHAE